jgi:hypothetical protein
VLLLALLALFILLMLLLLPMLLVLLTLLLLVLLLCAAPAIYTINHAIALRYTNQYSPKPPEETKPRATVVRVVI